MNYSISLSETVKFYDLRFLDINNQLVIFKQVKMNKTSFLVKTLYRLFKVKAVTKT